MSEVSDPAGEGPAPIKVRRLRKARPMPSGADKNGSLVAGSGAEIPKLGFTTMTIEEALAEFGAARFDLPRDVLEEASKTAEPDKLGPMQTRHGEILEPEKAGFEVLARLQAGVVLRHRGLYGKHYKMIERLNGMLEQYLDGAMNEDTKKLFMGGKATVPGYLVAMTAALQRLVTMERRSYGLANDSGGEKGDESKGGNTVFNIVIGSEQGYRDHQRKRLAEREARDALARKGDGT